MSSDIKLYGKLLGLRGLLIKQKKNKQVVVKKKTKGGNFY